MERRWRDLALLDLAINSKLRSCDVVTLRSADVLVSAVVRKEPWSTGGSGADTLVSIENLTGSAFADRLSGSGDDWLEGGPGRENIYGGSGADQFAFRDGDFAGLTPLTSDKINDFSQADGDTLHLGLVDSNVLVGGDQVFAFIGTDEFNNVAGELRYEVLNGNTYFYGDTDGDGAADFLVRLVGTYTLTEGDFVI